MQTLPGEYYTITSNKMLHEALSECSDISKIEWLPLTESASHVHLDVLEELECPVCLDDYIPVIKSVCGHHACQSCLKGMKDSGRTVCCPLCRDPRFNNYLVTLS